MRKSHHRSALAIVSSLFAGWSLLAGMAGPAHADPRWSELLGNVPIGASTRGGASPIGRIYRVTNLDDNGPGSLRHALARQGPRVVVFDVAGVIKLESDLAIFNPWITIAGQTAPGPVTLTGGTLRIRAGDVIIQHLAIRPGPTDDPKVNQSRDAVSIGPCSKCKIPPRGVLLDNVSLSWSIDENIGLFDGPLYDITVRNSIIAEGLRHGGHPKGQHSAGMLINPGSFGIEVVGNLFASNVFRNPAIAPGTIVVVANNHIYNPHSLAIHVNAGPESSFATRIAVINNVLTAGPDTRQQVSAVHVSPKLPGRVPDAKVFVDGSLHSEGTTALEAPADAKLLSNTPLVPANWDILPAKDVAMSVHAWAGARPADRDAVDVRIIEGVRSRSGRLQDAPVDFSPLESREARTREASVPSYPFSRSGIDGMLRIEVWLCLQHLAVGGPPNRPCNRRREEFEAALLVTRRLPAR